MIAKERLFLNASRDALFPENHAKAAFLYAAAGDEIPETAAEMFGLVDGGLPEGEAKLRKKGAAAAAKAEEEAAELAKKEAAALANKDAASGENKAL